MIKKINGLIIVMFIVLTGSVALALTSHTDYAQMNIKDCNACHESSGTLTNHGSFWMQEHRLFAEKKPNNCIDCHEQSDCLDCHKGGGINRDLHTSTFGADYVPRSHRSDFMELHPIKALDDPRSCSRCHEDRSFCNKCHSKFSRNDLRVVSHRRGFSDLNVKSGGPNHSVFTEDMCQTCHPNSLLPRHQWSTAHSREARKNLYSCQSCHPDGNICLKCHSSKSGLMVNPHPRDWKKISNRMKRASNERTCIRCH
jgi:hypothetical protein